MQESPVKKKTRTGVWDRKNREGIRARRNPLIYIPTAYSFSDLSEYDEEGEYKEFDAGDNGLAAENMVENIRGTFDILDILYNLKPNERIVFLIQLCREFGYDIDHGSYAKAIGIHRVNYMVTLSRVREKIQKMFADQI